MELFNSIISKLYVISAFHSSAESIKKLKRQHLLHHGFHEEFSLSFLQYMMGKYGSVHNQVCFPKLPTIFFFGISVLTVTQDPQIEFP